MAPRDTWSEAPDALERIKLLTSRGFTVPDIRANLAKARIPAPVTASGDAQRWSDALVSAAQEYLRRRGRPDAPPPAPSAVPGPDDGGPDMIRSVVATLDRALVLQAAMKPAEWEEWVASAAGKASVRQINACTLLLQVRTALEGGATASAPRLAEQLARVTASMEPGAPDQTGARASVQSVDDAVPIALADLPVIMAMVGRDTFLRAVGLREIHVEPLPLVPG